MAKKGAVQQLQADIQTDEDLEKFLERPGLLVLDIYSEWCGPCLGMVGSLRKIKLELGGDNLHLAICKSDTITVFERFRRKSEPSWMFVVNRKAVNLLFGSSVPLLMNLITKELNMLTVRDRKRYELDELHPREVAMKKLKDDAKAEEIRIELAEKMKKRNDYLTYVTDMIMENLPDMGVTLFGPQVNRDMFKKIMEPADVLKVQCKDRKVVQINKEAFETINFACNNPLSEDILDYMNGKDHLICYWKKPEDSKLMISEVLMNYEHDLTSKRKPADESNPDEPELPPILEPMNVTIEIELKEGEEYEEEEEEEPPHEVQKVQPSTSIYSMKEEEEEGMYAEEDLEDGDKMEEEMPMMEPIDFFLENPFDEEENAEEEANEPELEPEPVKRYRKLKLKIPPIWVPNNNRTHAALIYVYFYNQTTPFLPPDPVPEPPHIIMAFDAYKKMDLMYLAEKHKDDIPNYGFFTSDDTEDAELVARDVTEYAHIKHLPTYKLIFKVHKATSQTMLALANYGPSYVSPNTVIGREEALKLFPPDYYLEEEEAPVVTPEESKKNRRSTKPTKFSVADAKHVSDENGEEDEGEGGEGEGDEGDEGEMEEGEMEMTEGEIEAVSEMPAEVPVEVPVEQTIVEEAPPPPPPEPEVPAEAPASEPPAETTTEPAETTEQNA